MDPDSLFTEQVLIEKYFFEDAQNALQRRKKSERAMEEKARLIMKHLSILFPASWEMLLFGSVATGLSSPNSDIDISIFQDSYYFKHLTRQDKIQNLENILYLFLTNNGIRGELFQLCDCVYDARVPILRIQHIPSKIMVDLSSTNGLGVENSRLLRLYLDSDARVKWLVLSAQQWARAAGLLGKAFKFRSYAFTWLVLFFLMQISPPLVCPVFELYDPGVDIKVAGWNCGFVKKMPITSNYDEGRTLLRDFMNFIASTDFKNHVICPLTGYLISKTEFKNPDHLPLWFKSYQKRVKKAKHYVLMTDCAICIQDPLELSHNVTKQVGSDTLETLIESSKICYLNLHVLDVLL